MVTATNKIACRTSRLVLTLNTIRRFNMKLMVIAQTVATRLEASLPNCKKL